MKKLLISILLLLTFATTVSAKECVVKSGFLADNSIWGRCNKHLEYDENGIPFPFIRFATGKVLIGKDYLKYKEDEKIFLPQKTMEVK
jgi:hypothetical protein